MWLGLITTLSGFVSLAINPDFAVGTEPRRSPSSASTGTGSTGLRPPWWECRDWQSRGIPGSQIRVSRVPRDNRCSCGALSRARRPAPGAALPPNQGGTPFSTLWWRASRRSGSCWASAGPSDWLKPPDNALFVCRAASARTSISTSALARPPRTTGARRCAVRLRANRTCGDSVASSRPVSLGVRSREGGHNYAQVDDLDLVLDRLPVLADRLEVRAVLLAESLLDCAILAQYAG
jgi:hypothetical protein